MLRQAALASWKYDGREMTDALLIHKWFLLLEGIACKTD